MININDFIIRISDIILSSIGILILSPLIIIFTFLIYIQDFHNPFYIAYRVGLKGKKFQMFKLRSMIINADKNGVDSTSSDDHRITKIGLLIRKYKIDEIPQLINVFMGNMSLVGPRPNVLRETNLYTKKEKNLLLIAPGITDFSSIVFSDESEILTGSDDPDLLYNQIIRPGKSHLGLIYIEHRSIFLNILILYITVISIVNRLKALKMIVAFLKKKKVPKIIIEIASRKFNLKPMPPPGTNNIVLNRDKISL